MLKTYHNAYVGQSEMKITYALWAGEISWGPLNGDTVIVIYPFLRKIIIYFYYFLIAIKNFGVGKGFNIFQSLLC